MPALGRLIPHASSQERGNLSLLYNWIELAQKSIPQATTMKQRQKTQRSARRSFRHVLASIGLRLSLAFMVVILLTGLIGSLAVQRFSSLADTTTELNTHDLPEVVTLTQLRSLLLRQRDLELMLINGGAANQLQLEPGDTLDGISSTYGPSSDAWQGGGWVYSGQPSTTINGVAPQNTLAPSPTPSATPQTPNPSEMQTILTNLAATLMNITSQRESLLAFEQSNSTRTQDTLLVQKVADGTINTGHLSQKIQMLVRQNRIAEARTIESTQQLPLIATTIAAVTQLNTLEQAEVAAEAAQVQQESGRATFLIFSLTALGLFLSIMLALIITRSLTKPLGTLLTTTEALASGNLDAAPQVPRTDEIGRLANAYDKMRLNLRSTIASLQQERQQTQAIIDASTDGVILVDKERTILKFNPAAERLSGWQADEALGRHCWEIFGCRGTRPEEAEAHERVCPLSTLSHSDQPYLEMPMTSRTGQKRWLAVSCAPLPPDETTSEQRMVVGIHDISQLKAVEQMKSDFVALVSHELRAPLATVTGSVEMLGLLDPGADTDAYREVLSILDQQTQRLRQVVEEVLQVTRLDAGRLQVHLQPLSLNSFLRAVVARTRQEWVGSDHWVVAPEIASDIQVWADEGLLEIVLRNLLDNARKYSPPGTPIEVEARPSNDRVQIQVIDHGPGIPPDQLESIFERFSRGKQSSYQWIRGYGLGLYIARELLRVHNGAIRAENREGGACFTLSLWRVTDEQHPPLVGDIDSSPSFMVNSEEATRHEHYYSHD